MTTYCKSCGRECSPKQIRRPSEDYDPPGAQGRQITDWVSDCCGDEMTDVKQDGRRCTNCKWFDGREGIEDCTHPGPDFLVDFDEPCPQWREIK